MADQVSNQVLKSGVKMNFLAAIVCAVLLAGVASGSSLWSRELDPDTVERPIEEYREAYRRHLLTRRQEKECSADEIKACKADACPGWTLVTKDEKEPVCEKIGDQDTEAVFYVPDKEKPCCKYHGCVVADCKKLKARFEYDGTQKCTKDNKPEGKDDPCKHRVKKKTCGCQVEECEMKGCSGNVTCSECHILTAKTNECGCLTEKDSCELLKPDPKLSTCVKKTDCKDKCQVCKSEEKIFGDKCANKYKSHDKSYCEKPECEASEECNACQTPVEKDDGCCRRIVCQDIKEPAKCVKPDAKGKCADDCLDPVDKPLKEGGACKKTVKCCEPKKCVEKEPEVCEGCYTEAVEKDKCGCRHVVCKLDPTLEMCQKKVSYTVKVKTADAKSPALPKYTKLSNGDKYSVPVTGAKATIKITGACTPEQINDPNAELKECVVEIPAGKLANKKKRLVSVDKVCENIGIIKKVDVEMDDADIWFVEEVIVEAPKDLSKPDEKSPVPIKVEKFLGKKDPKHGQWKKVGPWEPVAEVVTGLVPGKECPKCEEYTRDQDVNCTSLHAGECHPKACPAAKPCGQCDVTIEYGNDCDCVENNCVKTVPPTESCAEGFVPVQSPAAPKESPCHAELCCVPEELPTTRAPPPECDQCHKLAITSVNVLAEDGKPYPLPEEICVERDTCMTEEEAKQKLNCNNCQEAVESDEETDCGCKKWVCQAKKADCKKCEEDECSKCELVSSEECKTIIATCVKKTCKDQEACTVPTTINGVQEVDKCGCPKYENKPCRNDHAHVCEPGKNYVASGIDACYCETKTLVPCEATPACNKTCFELVGEKVHDGCCTRYTCQKKECPEKPKVECPKCHRVVVHEDECKCCSTTCER